ncbi:MAG: aspartate carbamoyltransferase catalytic subunit [Pseudanabaena sp. M135S2SP2A07QC]|jgi:aspartate carbamoyltransferase catalytic subunit|nr:aspartate carbamoyltransferase catalytic subunit [Pseudanabaena sp. M090S1SP2A07QC]MCA6506552.1 aspartate carbamoyltransferase catalytic subunit [Pseudanabaena sp. M172S2SP2A07QC]MCA6518671.1 aspartate carbamoyltransferase catalytic subunit [Pseudanabaena sp. M110S1SP2A07QC]MCA6520409.1 aspartate carbamoyltransferase catalytic subunit [Pseudanabaena sp. M051S1SP2A07QC]MCA6526218.1 aspartate carbamoyltransferase catalytic subunit [Pseudanabaena sp. M179S2SP2A07QC]MCA6530128.1 aspartate carba
MTELTWQRRHVISLADFTTNDYETVLQTAVSFLEVLSRRNKKVPTLQSKVVANLFFESSTRTRNSFELAAKRLSADTLNFAPGTSALTKGETILDTARTFLAMGTDIMVIRHQSAGVPLAIARDMDALSGKVAILNAGDGKHEHPSQALLDLLTLCMYLNPKAPTAKDLKGKKVAIVGDILHSRVARSNLWSLLTNGADVHLAAPPTLLPPEFAEYGAKIHYTLEPALEDADFVMTLRLQMERMGQFLIPSLREYHARYGITRDHLAKCAPNVQVLHPGPVNRGVEISSDLMDDSRLSLIDKQVTNGVAIRMSLLYLLGTAI